MSKLQACLHSVGCSFSDSPWLHRADNLMSLGKSVSDIWTLCRLRQIWGHEAPIWDGCTSRPSSRSEGYLLTEWLSRDLWLLSCSDFLGHWLPAESSSYFLACPNTPRRCRLFWLQNWSETGECRWSHAKTESEFLAPATNLCLQLKLTLQQVGLGGFG